MIVSSHTIFKWTKNAKIVELLPNLKAFGDACNTCSGKREAVRLANGIKYDIVGLSKENKAKLLDLLQATSIVLSLVSNTGKVDKVTITKSL